MKKIYTNGVIITMSGQCAEMVVCEHGRIIGFEAFDNEEAEWIDLHGCTLMPAFIDAHSHITALASALGYVDLSNAASFEEIAALLINFKQTRKLKAEEWIIGFNYDHNYLREKRHPSRFDLDRPSLENPIMLTHASGHMGVTNSVGLKALGLDAKTVDPKGGRFGRDDAGELNGYMEENAFINASAGIPQPAIEALLKQLKMAQDIYLKNGITFVQEGIAREKEWRLLKRAAEENQLIVDVAAYVDVKQCAHILSDEKRYRHAQKRLRIAGYKLFLDGSPQGRTAWMLKPYLHSDNYCGYPVYDDEQVREYVKKSQAEGVQLLVHCNGDAAAQQLIDAYQSVLGDKQSMLRPVMIHAQLVNRDQLHAMSVMQMIASFFVAHVYHWGDIHCENFGIARASEISPVHSAILENVVYTFHQDTPVIQPDMLETLWCAVNRVTKSGRRLGSDEAISIEEALKAVTINAAYQYFEENERGSIEMGKLADFVILSQDPRQVDPMEIRDIEVLATIKEGRCCYRKNTFEK